MTDGLFSPERRSLTVGLVLTVTLVAFEALAVATIMPIVARELGDLHLYGWVFSAFLLGSLLGIVIVGGLIDRRGLAAPFVGGLGLFAIGLVIGGLAPSMPVLVAGRVLQGLGAGAIPPIAYVAIGRSLPDALRPRMFAILSTAWVLPGVVGPAVSGAIAEQFHWRVVFLGLLPLIAVAGALTLPSIAAVPAAPADPSADADPPAAPGSGVESRRRLPAALLVTVGTALLLAGLTSGASIVALGLVVVGLAVAVPAFGVLTPPGTLSLARGLPAAVLLRGLLTFAFFAPDTYVPYLLQEWRGTSASIAGIALTSATLTWTAGAWVQARWIERLGPRRLITAGFLVVGLGIAATTLVISPDVPVALAVVTWGVAGLGMGLSYSPLSIVVLREAAADQQGAATSGLQLSDTLGTALGAGVAGSIVAAGARAALETSVSLAAAFAVGAVVAGVGAFAARRLRGRVAPRAARPEAVPLAVPPE